MPHGHRYIYYECYVSGKDVIIQGRLTAIFEKIEDKWYFVHLH